MLKVSRYLDCSTNVEHGRERINVQEPAQEYCSKAGTNVDWLEIVFGKSEHRHSNVGEDEVLSHEVEKVKEVLG